MLKNSKLTRYLCAAIISIRGMFVCPWIFVKAVVKIHFEVKRNGWSLDLNTIIDTAKYGMKLYVAQTRAIFEWARDDDMDKYRRNIITYMKLIEP